METAGFSGVVAVGGAKSVSYERAVGFADRERRRAHRAEQLWPWASVTKQVAAALVMTEVDKKRLSLDAPLRSFLPEFSGPTGDRITLRHLLQHSSGLPNPIDTPLTKDGVPSFYRERGTAITDKARALGFCSGPPVAEPGAAFSYNNCDTHVVGAVLERSTGKSFAALVRDVAARPLGLKSLRLAQDHAPGGGSDVVGYEEGRAAPPMNFAALGAGGALVGTARDLVRLNQALAAHELVSAAATAEMWKGEPKFGYAALGAWSFPARLKGCAEPVALVERRGHFGGVQVRSLIAPALKRTVVAFTNNGDFEFGEIWQGKGQSYDLASAAFCSTAQR
jgi:CubicO group peptidase (beta-lactamase class C family)